MKTASKFFALFALVILWSCSNSDDDAASPDSGTISKDQVTGNWKVSYYYDNGKDETSDFSGYTFTFAADGIVTAYSSGQDYAGTWSIGEAGDDSSSSSNKLVISLSGNDRVRDLSDDWVILSLKGDEIRLKDDSSNSVEELHFIRE